MLLHRATSTIFIIFLLTVGVSHLLFYVEASEASVTVHFMDVGQGDSIFIDTSAKDVLVDGGGRSAGVKVVRYLLALNVTRIDILVATHADADHIGGLITVLSEFDKMGYSIPTVLWNGQPKDTQTYREFEEAASKRSRTVAERGQVYQLDSRSILYVLNPTRSHEFRDDNENSVVLRLVVNKVSFLFAGDAEEGAEKSMISSGVKLASDVLKVGHHGSRHSSTEAFLDTVSPKIAVVSAGKDNRYGHPHEETIVRLLERGIIPYGTHVSGDIIVATDGEQVKVLSNPQAIPEFPAFAPFVSALAFLVTLTALKMRSHIHRRYRTSASDAAGRQQRASPNFFGRT